LTTPEEDTFKLVVYVIVFAVNIWFLLNWLYYFVVVLTRIHFPKVKRVCGWIGWNLKDIEDYETNL